MTALIITRPDIQRTMKPADFLEAARRAFLAGATGQAHSPSPMHLPTSRGGFHAKGASISLDREYVAVKVNGNFPGNPEELGLPTIQGAVLLSDGSTGALLAILDSIEVTLCRTAAASALAASLLARPEARTLLICGAGEQGRAHAEALRKTLPIDRLLCWDRASDRAQGLARELGGEARSELHSAARSADVIVTCSSATDPYLRRDMVKPGTFIAAVGADSPAKSEIAPELMAASRVVTDLTAQCAEMGDLRHAVLAGAMTEADVHAELGQLIIGVKPGRASLDEIIIFDSTGTGLQDVAASAAIYERCVGDQQIQSVTLSAD